MGYDKIEIRTKVLMDREIRTLFLAYKFVHILRTLYHVS